MQQVSADEVLGPELQTPAAQACSSISGSTPDVIQCRLAAVCGAAVRRGRVGSAARSYLRPRGALCGCQTMHHQFASRPRLLAAARHERCRDGLGGRTGESAEGKV